MAAISAAWTFFASVFSQARGPVLTVYTFRNNFTYTGTAAVTPNTSTMRFASTAAAAINVGSSNVYYRGNFDAAGPFTLTGTFAVSDIMTLGITSGGVVNGGTVEIAGTGATATSIVYSHAYTGTAALVFSGADASVSTSAGATFDGMTGQLTVSKPGRTVTYGNAVTFPATKPILLSAGKLTFAGDVNTATATSTWTGSAGAQFNIGAGTTAYIGNLILNSAVFDKNAAAVNITNASAPCTNGALAVGNPICGGDVTD